MSIPKPQLYPASKIAVGAVLYSCTAWTDDAGKTSSQINEWVVRSIQVLRGSASKQAPAHLKFEALKFVNITEKIDGITWGKRSKKNGDFGWLKSIPDFCRKQFAVGRCLPHGVYTTERAAILHQISVTESYLAECKAASQADRDDVEIAASEAQLAALMRRFARLKSTAAKPGKSAPKVADKEIHGLL